MQKTVNFGEIEVLPDAKISKDCLVFMETTKAVLKATKGISSM